MNRTGPILVIVLVIVSNAFVLIGVATNRTGGAIETIELTERELTLQTLPEDNSGVTLSLAWKRPLHFGKTDSKPDFDRAKLQELGFDCPIPQAASDQPRYLLARERFVALEYEGAAWEKWLQSEEEWAKANPKELSPQSPGNRGKADWGGRRASRLFVVDAAPKAEQLRSKYPDQRKYLIVRAVITAWLESERDPATNAEKSRSWHGYVSAILPPEIYVPLPFAKPLSGLSRNAGAEPRYTVTLQYGRKLEPWIAGVKLLDKK